jgi:hypothetical protein
MYVWKVITHNNKCFRRFSKIYFKLKLLNYENKFTPIGAYTVIFTLNSCSSDASEASTVEAYSKVVVNYSYSTSELETLKLINDYRVSVGLNVLERINYISRRS